MTDYNKLRRNILQALYDASRVKGSYNNLPISILQDYGKIDNYTPDKNLLFELKYLEDKNFITVSWAAMNRIFGLSLTTSAVDLLEDPSEFNKQFPTNNVIMGNNNIIGNNNTIDLSSKIEQSNIDESSKEEILKFLSEISNAKASEKQKIFDKYILPLGQGVLVEFIKSMFF